MTTDIYAYLAYGVFFILLLGYAALLYKKRKQLLNIQNKFKKTQS